MATHAYLATLMYDSGGATYVTVGEVIEFTPPKQKVKEVDTSYLASTAATRTFIPGMIDPDRVSAKMNFHKTNFNTLYGFFTGRTEKAWKIRYNDGTGATTGSAETFNGFISEMGDQVPEDDRITTEITIKISGAVTFAVAT